MTEPRKPGLADTVAEEFPQDQLLSLDILLDAGLPTLVFVLVYTVSGQELAPALWAAVISGALITGVRLLRRQSLQHAIAGFVGLGVAAWFAARSGQAADFFLPSLLINLGYVVAYLISILVRWPLLGVLIGLATGEGMGWRDSPYLLRAYTVASWFWVAMFALRLLVQVPLFLAEDVVALGVAKLAMGWPLFLLCLYLSWLVISRARRAEAAAQRLAQDLDDSAVDDSAVDMSDSAVAGKPQREAESSD